MKIVRAKYEDKTFYGVQQGECVKEICATPYESVDYTGREYALNDVKLLAPCEPTKIVAIGLNYAAHIDEMKKYDLKGSSDPTVFLKPTTTIIATGEEIERPVHMSQRTEYEGELGIVMGKKAKNITTDEAKAYILGYTCANDVTARDLQHADGQWIRSKGFDTFCPLGPCIETDLDPDNAHISTILNGEIKQDDTTHSMIYTAYELVSFVSKIMTLLPGDVIITGSPKGVAPMEAGDEVIVKIEGIGELRNIVK